MNLKKETNSFGQVTGITINGPLPTVSLKFLDKEGQEVFTRNEDGTYNIKPKKMSLYTQEQIDEYLDMRLALNKALRRLDEELLDESEV